MAESPNAEHQIRKNCHNSILFIIYFVDVQHYNMFNKKKTKLLKMNTLEEYEYTVFFVRSFFYRTNCLLMMITGRARSRKKPKRTKQKKKNENEENRFIKCE